MIRHEIAALIGRVRPTAIIFGVLAFIGLIYLINVFVRMIGTEADAATLGLMFGAILLLAGTIGTCAAESFRRPASPRGSG